MAWQQGTSLPAALVQSMQEAYAARWCTGSSTVLRCTGCTIVCGDWACTHGVLPRYSLTWHEMLQPLVHALVHASKQEHNYPDRHMLGVGDVYAFGMAHGHTLPMFRKLLPEPTRIFGFDSFRGLPAEDDERSKMPGWKPGAFKPKHSIWVTPERLEQSAGGRPRAVITPGFFDKTLSSQLVVQQNMSRALYVDIDCDLHSSTVTVLDWLLHHKIMQLGTLIGACDTCEPCACPLHRSIAYIYAPLERMRLCSC